MSEICSGVRYLVYSLLALQSIATSDTVIIDYYTGASRFPSIKYCPLFGLLPFVLTTTTCQSTASKSCHLLLILIRPPRNKDTDACIHADSSGHNPVQSSFNPVVVWS